VSVITETAVTVIVRQPTVPIAIATVVTFNVLNVYLLALSPHNVPTVQVSIVQIAKANHIYRLTVTAQVVMPVTVMIQSVTIVALQRLLHIIVTVRVTVLRLFVPNYMNLV
jgi:hypothetical protein